MPKGKPINGRHPNFKGGRSVASNGYIIVFVGVDHHLADVRGYTYEHRLEAEKKIGRRLEPGEQVHHKDEDRQNNAHDNLVVCRSKAHHFLNHRTKNDGKKLPDEENIMIECACGCGKTFLKFDKSNRPRKFITGHNNGFKQQHTMV